MYADDILSARTSSGVCFYCSLNKIWALSHCVMTYISGQRLLHERRGYTLLFDVTILRTQHHVLSCAGERETFLVTVGGGAVISLAAF